MSASWTVPCTAHLWLDLEAKLPAPPSTALPTPQLLNLLPHGWTLSHKFGDPHPHAVHPHLRTWFSLTAVAHPPPPSLGATRPVLRGLDTSRLTDTRKHPAIEVLSWSCSTKRTWTTTQSGSLSFWAVWVHDSRNFLAIHQSAGLFPLGFW